MKRAWLYFRLSRDEDQEQNSLQNQRQILVDYADKNDYKIIGESFDDNVTGMTFERDGIIKLEEAVDKGQIDTVLVKDMSRLGRHRTQTAIFLDIRFEMNGNWNGSYAVMISGGKPCEPLWNENPPPEFYEALLKEDLERERGRCFHTKRTLRSLMKSIWICSQPKRKRN